MPESHIPFEQPARLSEIATRAVIHLDAACTLQEAAAIMAERHISSIVVTENGARPCGIITEQNILRAMQSHLRAEANLAEAMTAPIIVVPQEMESQEAYMLCLREGIRHLVVVDGAGDIAGVISETDFRLHLNLTALSGRRPAATAMSRSVLSLPPASSLQEALDLMRENRENCVVVAEENIPVGIITERDLVRLFSRMGEQTSITLKSVMSSPPATARLDTPLNDIAERMLSMRLRHLIIVTASGHLAGLISEHELTQIMAFGLVDTQSHDDRTFLRTLLDAIPDLIWLKDPDGVYLACNSAFERIYGVSEREIVGRTDADFVDHTTAELFRQQDRQVAEHRSANRNEVWLTCASDGYRGLFETIRTPVSDRSGHLLGVLGIARDISEYRRIESALADSRTLLNTVIDSTSHLVLSVDAHSFSLLTFNAGLRNYFQENYGITISKGMRPEDLFTDPGLIRQWRSYFRRALEEQGFSTEYSTFDHSRVFQLNFSLLRRDDQVFGISVYGEDITARKDFEARIQYLVYHDTLTGLPNQALVQERFKLAASYATRTQARIALLLLDIDRFKEINDALGHTVGDRLLQCIAERLSASVREADTVCRLGGDDFLILLTDIHDPEDVASFASKLNSSIPAAIEIDQHRLSVTLSIGIALYPDDARDMDELMKQADTALFVVKDAGRDDFRFFDEAFNAATVEALALKNELRLAVEGQEFLLHYQPQIDLASGRMVGAEALVRWQSPSRGLVPPGIFIPVAEESGLILPIGEWVLQEACHQAAQWRRSGLCDDLSMAVNLSAVQFARGDLEQTVMHALERSGLEPQALELELTESILVRDPEAVLAIVQRLKRLGIGFSIDDFGTGYSSLSYLKRFPVDKLKIDQSFIRNMATDNKDAEIVRASIQMAHAMGLKTIAEGIEEEMAKQHLRLHHCDQGQGFLFSRPLPPGDFAAFARANGQPAVEPERI